MATALERYRRPGAVQRATPSELLNYADSLPTWGLGMPMPVTTLPGPKETIEHAFEGYVQAAYKQNGVVFACVLARMLLFQEARFQWQRLEKGKPGDLFGSSDLRLLERPQPGKTTREMSSRAEQDVSLGGNWFATTRRPGQLRRLQPDWVTIISGSPERDADVFDEVTWDLLGYMYVPGGARNPRGKPTFLLPDEVVHWAPIPDPLSPNRGMSWVMPVVRNIEGHNAATDHKIAFFQSGATPNMVVKFDATVAKEAFDDFVRAFDAGHKGTANAYKTIYLGGGADAEVVGSSFEQMSFKATQGADETQICSAAGVPPIIVGVSEGLQAATYSNYAMARRKFGDHWARPQWGSFAAALEHVLAPPGESARLWYDDRNIAFLREDRKDEVEIDQIQASTMRQLIEVGFTAESTVAAVGGGDFGLLVHSGLYSVQLQAPGGDQDPVVRARALAETLQKLYLAVGPVITPDEARQIANTAGAALVIPGPADLAPKGMNVQSETAPREAPPPADAPTDT